MQIKEILNANVSNQNIKNEPVGTIDAKGFSDLILSNLGNINQSPEAVISTLADAFSDVSFSRDEKNKVDFVKEKFNTGYQKQQNPKDKELVEKKVASKSGADEDYEKDSSFDDDDEIKEVALDTLIALGSFEPQNLNKADVDNEVLSFSKDIFKDNIDANLNNVSDVDASATLSPSSFNDNTGESFDNDFLAPLMQASLNKAENISDVQVPANINANFNNEDKFFDTSLSLGQSNFANQDVVQAIKVPVISKQGENLENADFFVPAPENQNEPLSFTVGQKTPLKTEEMPIEALEQDVLQTKQMPQDIDIQKVQKNDKQAKNDDFFGVSRQAFQLSEDLAEVLGETQTNLKLKVNIAGDKNSQNSTSDFNKDIKENAFKSVEPQNVASAGLKETVNLGEFNQEIKKTTVNPLEKSSTEFNKSNANGVLPNVSEQSDADVMLQTNVLQNNNTSVVGTSQAALKVSAEAQIGKFSSIQSASEIAQGKSSGSQFLGKTDGQIGLATETQFSNLVNNAGKKDAAGKASSAVQNLPARTVEQIKVNIARALNSGIDRINVSLNPKELGKIQVKMILEKDGKVSASIAAASKDTLDMLMKDAKILQNALSSVGFDVDDASLKFSLLNQGEGNSSGQNYYADADKIENNIVQSENLLSSEGSEEQIISDTKVNIKV